ncbi:MAG: efflux RND transporter periplasmic adaptor subunit [Muribaculaceae bacterium]|nr:efflux RND transporter periplasmic adaptor subunit [Muribaculaceae bacterium]
MKHTLHLPFALAITSGLILTFSSCKKHDTKSTEEIPPIEVAVSATDSVTTYSTIPGSLHAENKVDLVARVNGYLRSINYKSGDIVEKGQLLFTIEDTQYRDAVSQAAASLASAKSAREYAASHYAAMEKALKSDAVSVMEVKQAKSALEQADADIRTASAQLQTARTQLGYCRVYAPFRGRISASGPSVGAYLSGEGAAVTMATIYDDSDIQAYFTIEDASFLKSFADGREKSGGVNYDSIPIMFSEELPHTYSGSLSYLSPDIDSSTGTMQLRAKINNPYGELRDGMYVSVKLPTGVSPHAVIIKDASIASDQLGKYIYTVNDSNKVVYTPIKVGSMANDSMRVVLSGLQPGTKYVTKALLKVRPGMEIKPIVKP